MKRLQIIPIVSSLLWSPFSIAGTFTDAPGALQGDVALRHMYKNLNDSLYESDLLVGKRQQMYNDTSLAIKIGLLDFMSFEAVLPYGIDTVRFSESYEMKYDPITQSGSYLDTPQIEDFSRNGGGLEGVQLGLYFYPFHSKIYSNRGDVGNWQMGVIYRSPDKTHFYAPDEDGARGSGVGSQGFGVHTPFSKKQRGVEPYLSVRAIRSGQWTGDIRDDEGKLYKEQATFEPAHTVDFRAGTEIYLQDDVALASYITLDLFGQYKYSSFQAIPSGTYLPNVLETTQDTIITQTELVSIEGGIGTNVQINSLYALRFSGQVGFLSPQRIEHIYQINTLGTFQWGLFGELRFRYRTTSS